MRNATIFTQKIVGIIAFLMSVFIIQAQPNTLIVGKIENAKILKEIEISLNKLYLNNNVEIYTSRILEDNTFAFAVEVDEPQIAMLEYARNKGVVYLEPNDTLYINCDANNFQYSFEFGGGLAEENNCLSEYLQKNPRETSVFNMTQYKQKTYWYQNSPKMDKLMLAMNRPSFENHMNTRKDNSMAILKTHETKEAFPGQLSEKFKKFYTAEVRYDFAYHKMLYGNVFKNRYSLTEDYFDFVNEIPLHSDQIGNEWYREFLVAYFDYQCLKNPDGRPDYVHQYESGTDILEGKTQAFFQSEIIARAFRAKENEVIMEKYWDYMRHQDFGNFDEKVIETYSKAIKFAGGTVAPDFVLQDIDDNAVSLAKYRGQVVYLNFWASWCRPCMQKMDQMKPIQAELENQGIVFVNVSLDRKAEVWKETLEKKSFKGVHILASGELNSDIAKAYEIKVLPRYFIINKDGVFVKNPKSNALDLIKAKLLEVTTQ